MQLPSSTFSILLAVTVALFSTLTSANPVEVNNSPIPPAFTPNPTPSANASANANGPPIRTPERPDPTVRPEQATDSQSLVHSIATLASSAASSLAPTCPPTRSSRQCCTSVDSLADEVVGENAVGGLIPWLQAVQISSTMGVQCKVMGEDEQNIDCLSSVMCCTVSGNVDVPKPGTQSLFKSGCIAYDKAIRDKEAIEKSKAEARYLAAHSTSVPTPTPSS